jgi:hypothetical protein
MKMTTTQPRMGRPLKPGGPLSNKERQQRWRDKVKRQALELLEAIGVAKIQQK